MKTLQDILNPLRVKARKLELSCEIGGLARSAQDLKPGEVFFAIRGSQKDGHSLIPMALEKGASAVIVEQEESYHQYPKAIWVDCTRSQLAESASAFYGFPSDHLTLVGITGTNGKTTCAYLMREIWKGLGLNSGMIGTVETLIGNVSKPSQLTTPGPLELQELLSEMVQSQVSHSVMEVSSIALHQKRVGGCSFKAALFTNFTQDHLDYHETFENYFQSKLKLFTDFGLPLAVLNMDDEWVKRVLVEGRAKQVLTFSLKDPSADFFASDLNFSVTGTQAKIKTPRGIHQFETSLIGAHNLTNALAVLACSYGLGMELSPVMEILKKAVGAPGRLERAIYGKEYPSVFVDYAHTDDALKNVIEALLKLKKPEGRLITVFGCGGDRDKTKRPKMGQVASSLSDLCVVTSDNPRTEDPHQILRDIQVGLVPETPAHLEVQRKNAIEWALAEAKPQDIVLIAGKGHENYQIIGTTQFPFDDRKVVRDYYTHAQPSDSSKPHRLDPS